MTRSASQPRDETDDRRAESYDALALLLAASPPADVLRALSDLSPDEGSALGAAWADLAKAAASTTPEAVEREFFDLFIGVGRGELLPYASFYLTGFLNERPLAVLRGDLAALGIARRAGDHDPEDRIALLCAVMAAFAGGSLTAGEAGPGEALFFNRHLAPWAGMFFDDLEKAPAAKFYAAVGRVGRLFMEIEAQGFALAAEAPEAA
ncbi:TorD/DmsD family molecular chaperone [Falsigemmobacter faecalis]|uniref:TorD/DmsD family molecular chaperone n=1 Tax=Falsigemmobacter faecalis TaxID=2488730 RepID=UPI001F1840B5|nr:molecular chaperone TorD family protein [Falsigemmobacter faecalis]